MMDNTVTKGEKIGYLLGFLEDNKVIRGVEAIVEQDDYVSYDVILLDERYLHMDYNTKTDDIENVEINSYWDAPILKKQ